MQDLHQKVLEKISSDLRTELESLKKLGSIPKILKLELLLTFLVGNLMKGFAKYYTDEILENPKNFQLLKSQLILRINQVSLNENEYDLFQKFIDLYQNSKENWLNDCIYLTEEVQKKEGLYLYPNIKAILEILLEY